MSDLSSVTTLQELIEFLSEFLATVPTTEYVDQQLEKKVGLETLSRLLPNYVTRVDFRQRLAAKAGTADLINAVASKAERNEISNGIARKANLSSLYALESKINKRFPFKCVESIAERNRLTGDDLDKVVLVVDASADPKLSSGSNGAMYMFSKFRNEWVMESEIKYNAEQISYSKILGRPVSSAQEIDTVVGIIMDNLTYLRDLHETNVKSHVHQSALSDIENAVAIKHSHVDASEIFDVDDNDLIPIIRDGVIVNVKAHALKSYLNR